MQRKPFRINLEVHAGWCPPGTSNPVGLPLVDRSVRFRHTSAKVFVMPVEHKVLIAVRGNELYAMPRKPPKEEAFHGWKEVKRQARERVGFPPPTKRRESPRNKPPKHKKLAREEDEDPT